MIYHKNLLDHVDAQLLYAIELIHRDIAPHDIFIVATDKQSWTSIPKMQTVAKGSFTKNAWQRSIDKSQGIVFFVTNAYFRHKARKPIVDVMVNVKNQIDGLILEWEENAKFAGFFIGFKPKKEKQDEPETI